MELWFVRNEELHNNEDSTINKKVHSELNIRLDRVYEDKPHSRLLPAADNLFFRRKLENVKKLRRRQKERWVTDAEGILAAYTALENEQTRNFTRFFTQDRETTINMQETTNTMAQNITQEETRDDTGEATE